LGWNPSQFWRKGGTDGPAGLSKKGREVRWQANGKKKSSVGANGKNRDCRPRPGSRAKRPGKSGPERPPGLRRGVFGEARAELQEGESLSIREAATFLLIRAITYSALFIGFILVFLPARVLSWSGIVGPVSIGAPQVAGAVVGASGAVLALWCIVTFIVIGRGTPAPFDPPRRLVVAGPYLLVRNPMYLGAGLALAGAALFYESWALLGYCAAFVL